MFDLNIKHRFKVLKHVKEFLRLLQIYTNNVLNQKLFISFYVTIFLFLFCCSHPLYPVLIYFLYSISIIYVFYFSSWAKVKQHRAFSELWCLSPSLIFWNQSSIFRVYCFGNNCSLRNTHHFWKSAQGCDRYRCRTI